MAKKNRNSLKNDFREGALPSAESFADLIDSSLNTVDDGFEKTDAHGLKLAQVGKSGRLLSFFENIAGNTPDWSVQLGQNQGRPRLWFAGQGETPLLTLASSRDGENEWRRVGINKTDPAHDLDVDGVVAARGRIGAKGLAVAADGDWHAITGPLDGCRAFEVMAGVGDKDSGRYALLHATALNVFNSRGQVRSTQSYYGSRCDQIDLRWRGEMHAYTLQLRTRCAYPAHVVVQFYLSELWFDPFMQGCDARQSVAASGDER